jgi:hypothetical protein
MLKEYARKTNIGVGIGFITQLIGRAIAEQDDMFLLGVAIAFVGFSFFIWGCAQYARGKGHSPWLGPLGLLSLLGLIVLFLLPDRHKQAS